MTPEYRPYSPRHPLLRAILIITGGLAAGVAAVGVAAWLWPAQMLDAAIRLDSAEAGPAPAGLTGLAVIIVYLLYRLGRAARS
jgi:hypothetical protein